MTSRPQLATVDRAALVAVVGNEDGERDVGAELFQGLNDVEFTIPAGLVDEHGFRNGVIRLRYRLT